MYYEYWLSYLENMIKNKLIIIKIQFNIKFSKYDNQIT
jgi:hypothetical protein